MWENLNNKKINSTIIKIFYMQFIEEEIDKKT